MMKEILILTDKLTDETSVYQLVNNEYIGYFDKNIQKIPFFDGFELLLTSQFDVNFVSKENMDWLIDILNINQYNKMEDDYCDTDTLYKKGVKSYILEDTITNCWWLDYHLIWLVFETKFKNSYKLFKLLTKVILSIHYKCEVMKIYVLSINKRLNFFKK